MNDRNIDFLVAQLTPSIGGLVSGVDLTKPLSERVVEGLREVLAERHVLFFENQNLEPRAQRDFAARFGDLHVHPLYPHVDGVPEITSIETRPDYLPDNDNWHTDVTFIQTPPFGAVLTPRVLPPSGGDTLWSSTVAAYQGLSEPLRRFLDGLTAEHSFEKSFPRHRWGLGEKAAQWEKAVAANPPVVHPVVRTIEGGRRGLFVNSGFTSRILELTPKESDALLAFLFEHMAKPEFTVRWRWKFGDVAFWDNRLSTHYATVDFLPHPRVMNRAAILGDRPH
ncbi:MAG TPA: taurine dioxygenase [Roseiarcus sp.]|jgi:taurine dioxygenase|nr:taurine dioxygenase [Roseiarcus sp.]